MSTGGQGPATAQIEPPLRSAERARWGVAIGWASRPEPIVQVDADAELRVASVAKLLLLAACASAIESGETVRRVTALE